MSDIVLRLYHHLPVPLRSVAASLRGLYLPRRSVNSSTPRRRG
jgi:hypothetical protein